jgi:hypothetical protein
MKKLIVTMMLIGGAVVYGDAVFARGAGGSSASGPSGTGAAAGAGNAGNAAAPGTAATGSAGVAGPGAAGDNSAPSTREGDVSGMIRGNPEEPAVDASSASRWPNPFEGYPSASPASRTVIVPPATTVVVPAPAPGVVVTPGTAVVPVDPSSPLMCPGINPSDPRLC